MASQPGDLSEFPAEITAKPLALVGVSGLDAVNNAVHKAIWDALSSPRRGERAPVRFKLLNNTFEFPVIKPKRNSYEWYIPKGILKKNWINKRLSLIPAVIVIFYDMEWNDPQWSEKIIECASRVQSIRAAIEGHTTRVAVVIVQSGLSPPPSEYMLGAERAQSLCSACEIQSKSLFVLPHSDHLMGYIVRLENAFYDIAQNYYHHETKTIKQHRDHLNKTTHQYLFVRHQFKLGYLNELKQDFSTAHKHYMHAYNNLLETRSVDTNVNEIRTVAGFINYKLCKLLFVLNLPRDAIAQLKSHVERYKGRVGNNELLFEHYAWIARQYSSFGELFDEAVRAGLPGIQSQHPGFYYQQAAQYTVKRRQAMRSVCSEVSEFPPPPNPLDGIIEYYGQRPWRPGRLSADPHDPQKEQAAIIALQFNEKNFNHSNLIINFLGSAISQFKTFHSPRMRKQLVVEMANEYYFCADYAKALTLLSHMLWDYKRERWWFLASHVLNRALQCAYLTGKVQDYVQLSIEALSKYIRVPNNDKERIFSNIQCVLSMNTPGPEPELEEGAKNAAAELWRAAERQESINIPVEMTNSSSFLQVKPNFRKPTYKMDETILVDLYVRMTCASTLEVKKAFFTVSSQKGIVEIPVLDEGAASITLRGDQVRKFLCQFKPDPQDRGTDISIKTVTLILKSDDKRKVLLNYKMDNKMDSQKNVHPELLHFIVSSKGDHEFDSVIPTLSAHVTSRDCRVGVATLHQAPALQGEWFPTTIVLTSNEENTIRDLKMSLTLLSSTDNQNPESATELGLQEGLPQTLPLNLPLESRNLDENANVSGKFYLKSNRTATIVVQAKVSYIVNLPEISRLECVKDFQINISVVKPFEVTANYVSTNFNPITKCFVDDPFIVMPQIKIVSPWDLLILDTELEPAACYGYADSDKPSSCVSNLEVCKDDIASDAVCLLAKCKSKDTPTRVGLYNIKWRRKSGGSSIVMSSSSLPALPVSRCPIGIEIHYPEIAELQTPLPLKCTLTGKSEKPTRLSITVEGSDAYMFSGYKKVSVTVPPKDQVELCYVFHPMNAGNTAPPRLRATVLGDSSDQDVVDEMLDKNFPRNIFVMPKYNKQ